MTAKEREYFLALRDSVVGCDVMVDKLVIKDVKLTSANDDNYFVFEDTILQVSDHTGPRHRICTWLRDFSSCPSLILLRGPAWLLLNKICIPLFWALYVLTPIRLL